MRRPRSSPRSCVSGSAPPGMEHLRPAGTNVVGMTDPELDAPKTIDLTFDDLGLDERVLKALKKIGYESPSPIQAETIPPLLEGRHVVGLAQTGTGKTAAFALPILSQLDLKQKTPQALVLAPTRELALQRSEEQKSELQSIMRISYVVLH